MSVTPLPGAAGQFLAKYAESGFEAVWFASAFKGTTGPAQAWPPLNHHVRNQLSWLRVMQAMPRFAPLRFQGIVLTGWQRWAPCRASQPHRPGNHTRGDGTAVPAPQVRPLLGALRAAARRHPLPGCVPADPGAR